MHEFAEEYVANLKPRDERYDTRLGDDFYVATFPNGVKTWIHLYQVNDFTRRQTLGVYPEMPLPVALEALYAARRTRAVESDLAEQGLDGTQVREAENSPIDLTAAPQRKSRRLPRPDARFLAGALAGVGLGLIAGLAAWQLSGEEPAASRAASVPRTEAPVPVVPVTTAESRAVGSAGPAVSPAQSGSIPDAPPAPPRSAAAEPSAAPDQSYDADLPVTVSPEERADPETDLGTSQQALLQLQQDLAGTLAWAQLTSDVLDGEPVDRLGWVVEVGERPRRVFYFVRVRGMAGEQVKYVWRWEGQVLKEDAVSVGSGWHSPAYSGMTLTPERLGRWQVDVIGPDGEQLGSEQFETRRAEDAILGRR